MEKENGKAGAVESSSAESSIAIQTDSSLDRASIAHMTEYERKGYGTSGLEAESFRAGARWQDHETSEFRRKAIPAVTQDPFKDLARYRLKATAGGFDFVSGPWLETGRTYEFIMLDEVTRPITEGEVK